MFLTGIFLQSNNKSLSEHSLNSISTLLDKKHLKKVVKDVMSDLVIGGFQRGVVLEDISEVEKYVWGITNNSRLSERSTKIRHKEFNIFTMDNSEDGVPHGYVPDVSLHSEMSLVEQDFKSWLTLANKGTVESREFKDEVLENIEIFNEGCVYLEDTYGFSFKVLLVNAINGVSLSGKYLTQKLEEENDLSFLEALAFLTQYEEFYDYLKSNSPVLTYGGSYEIT